MEMDFSEDLSPLNRAHLELRKAEKLLSENKFDACIDCHENATGLLKETCKLTQNERALESLNLQIDYHKKEINIVNIKKEFYYRTLLKEHQRKMFNNDDQNGEKMVNAVFKKTFEVHDSLIEYLGKRGTGSDNDSSKSTSDPEDKSEKAQIVGNKHPKDESQMIEELTELSCQLRSTVQCLLAELEDRNREIQTLKERITLLETEKEKVRTTNFVKLNSNFSDIPSNQVLGNTQSKNNSSLKVITDSSGATSPYVFSPSSELSPDINETTILPPLAPLEMPNFDFLNRIRNTNCQK